MRDDEARDSLNYFRTKLLNREIDRLEIEKEALCYLLARTVKVLVSRGTACRSLYRDLNRANSLWNSSRGVFIPTDDHFFSEEEGEWIHEGYELIKEDTAPFLISLTEPSQGLDELNKQLGRITVEDRRYK